MSSVDAYAKDIMNSSKRICKGRTVSWAYMMATMYGAAIGTTIQGALQGIGIIFDPAYHASGGIATGVARFLDHATTYPFSKLFEDPRLFEYGLDKFYEERNPDLGKHPTRKDIISPRMGAKDSFLLLLGTTFPPAGFTYLAMSPLVAINNRTITRRIRKSYQIGDEVKEKLERGESEEDIRKWLHELDKL